jgi:hypothetical protein
VAFIETTMNKRTKGLAIRASLARCPMADRPMRRPSVSQQIVDFLDGRNNGEALLHALYDHILDEPIPAAMRQLLDEHRD